MFIRNSRNRSFAILGMLALIAQAAPLQAADFEVLDDPAQVDEMAGGVQRTLNLLCWEMHHFHRDKADFADLYRSAKDLWSMSGTLRDALRAGTVDPATLNDQVARMNEALTKVEKGLAGWGDGVRPPLPTNPDEARTVVVGPSPVDVEVPLLFGGAIRVGGPTRMVVADAPPLPRRRFHPNAHGSKRALDRELAGVRTAMNYLIEDTGADLPVPNATASPSASPTPAPPAPMPPETNAGPVLKISPPVKKS